MKLWLVTGNLSATAAALDIKLTTMKEWRYSKWWTELVNEIKTENTITLSNKLKAIANKALDVSLDRLENGEWIYDQKTGEMRRKPVQLRDAHTVAKDLLERSTQLEKKPVEEKQQQTDLLLNLAKKFEEFSKKRVEVIEVVNVNG